MSILTVLIVLCLFLTTHQRSTPQDDHYIAAVVEYTVSRNVQANRENYIRLIQEAATQNADIVVFPELTLTNSSVSFSVPIHGLLKEYPVPALHPELYDELLVSMSSAARQNQIYVVINIRELMDCTQDTGELCPEPKQYIFNTNVVLDRSGAVIDRYRKINLFGEASHTPALKPDLGLFLTDFGVTFGHFICFDIMFQVPAVQVVQKNKITDVIFTTMWFSELPFLTAVQYQEAYAYSMNINLLGSGANNVAVGSAGSGIYSGKAGALVSIMPGVPTTRLLVAKVPKVPGQVTETPTGPIYDKPTDHDGLRLITDPSLRSHISRPLVQGFQEFQLVDKDVSCTFRIRMSQRNGSTRHRYRAFVYDGTTTYSRRDTGNVMCCVVACKDDDVTSCGYKYSHEDETINFEELEIEMSTYRNVYNTSLECDNIVYFPVSVRDSKFPLDPSNYTFTENGVSQECDSSLENSLSSFQNEVLALKNKKENLFYKMKAPQNEIVSFGIYGRIYTRDVDHSKHVTEADVKAFNNIMNDIYSSADEHNHD